MSFNLITGKPGEGKSYQGAQLVMDCLREGGMAFSNMPIVLEKVSEYGWSDRYVQLPANPKAWVKKEIIGTDEAGDPIFKYSSDYILGGVEGSENIVVLDEASLNIKTSSSMTNSEKEKLERIIDLTRLHRHVGLDIYFIVHDPDHIPKQFKDLAATRIVCRNNAKIPVVGPIAEKLRGRFTRTIFMGKARKSHSSYNTPFRQEVGDFYLTHGEAKVMGIMTGGQRVKKTSQLDKAMMVKLSAMVLGCFALFAIAAFLGSSWVVENKDKWTKKETPPKAEKPLPEQSTASTAPKTPKDAPKRPQAGMVGIEWDSYDEHVIAVKRKVSGVLEVTTRDGLKLRPGLAYEGQKIAMQFEYAEWIYFRTELGRVIVARPLLPQERRELPRLTTDTKNTESIRTESVVINPLDSVLKSTSL